MPETIQHLLTPGFFVGAVLGALIGIYLTLKAQRPRLMAVGGGGGGNQERHSWSLTISNRPSFFGSLFNGEPALDVHANLSLRDRDSARRMLYWRGQEREQRTTINPGEQRSIELFTWSAGERGYSVLDYAGVPVDRFEARRLDFLLYLYDRLERTTVIPFTVIFDETPSKNIAHMEIRVRRSIQERLRLVKDAIAQILSAFDPRQ